MTVAMTRAVAAAPGLCAANPVSIARRNGRGGGGAVVARPTRRVGLARPAGGSCRAERVEERPADLLNDPRRVQEEYERGRDERKKLGLQAYESLKRELSLTTVNVAVGVGAYCFLVLSPEVAASYGIGSLTSLGYLQLMYKHIDNVSEDNVPQIFVQRRRAKRIGITSSDVSQSFEKLARGSYRALSSVRLVIPVALFGLWALTTQILESSPVHLQVVPLMFGFFSYKGAALVQAYRDNSDLIFDYSETNRGKDDRSYERDSGD